MAKTIRERNEEKRIQKLEEVAEQVKSGDLVIRKMTAAERKKFPAKPPKPPKNKR